MENYNYENDRYDYEDDLRPDEQAQKSIRGYRVVIVLLAVILA